MAKLLSDQTASELPAIFEAVRNISQVTRGQPNRRDRGGTGSTGSRSYIVITAVVSASVYTGDVLTSPTDTEVLETGVAIQILDATFNELGVGFSAFADVADDIYYIEGALLG